jgi:uncharacterized protein YdeI (YjbR/CyaY-like superfamily)
MIREADREHISARGPQALTGYAGFDAVYRRNVSDGWGPGAWETVAMVVPHTERERFHAEHRAQWRDWLVANHGDSTGVWLVSWKSATGRPRLTYEESIEEALCVGWVDSTQRTIDDERSMLWFAPRRSASAWSRPNKERVARLTAAGLMLPAGLAAVATAQASGAWSRLDEVEDLVVPADLAAAFDARPGAREQWDAFPRSARRAILEWIVQARRDETRRRRIEETAEKAAHGERANEWRPRT